MGLQPPSHTSRRSRRKAASWSAGQRAWARDRDRCAPCNRKVCIHMRCTVQHCPTRRSTLWCSSMRYHSVLYNFRRVRVHVQPIRWSLLQAISFVRECNYLQIIRACNHAPVTGLKSGDYEIAISMITRLGGWLWAGIACYCVNLGFKMDQAGRIEPTYRILLIYRHHSTWTSEG